MIPPCHIYAYCLMPNHVHLLIAEKDWKVGEVEAALAPAFSSLKKKIKDLSP